MAWLPLVGLIHDLGKILVLPEFGAEPQWASVGDTFPVGCAFDKTVVRHDLFRENPDNSNPLYVLKLGEVLTLKIQLSFWHVRPKLRVR